MKSTQRLLKMMILYAAIKMNTCDRFHCYDWVIYKGRDTPGAIRQRGAIFRFELFGLHIL
jgi:hypothetical protein